MKRFFCLFSMLALFAGLRAQVVSTYAGQTGLPGDRDGAALTLALFNNPHGIATDAAGNVYVADRWNHKIRKITPEGEVTTLAGTGESGRTDGPGSIATFYEPWGVAASSDGIVYVADTRNNLIRKIEADGTVSTLAGTGAYGVLDGPALQARFANPTGIAIDAAGILYACDHLGHTLRKITPQGVVSRLAGQAFVTGSNDGTGSGAKFYRPYGIEVDLLGNVYVADEWNHLIRKVTPNGTVTTVAGTGLSGNSDGPAELASFYYPWDIAIDASGVLYVMDGSNFAVRRISTDGSVSTYAGQPGISGGQDGPAIEASFNGATGIAIDGGGALFIADAYNNSIRKITPSNTLFVLGNGLSSNDTLCLDQAASFQAAPATYASYDFYVNNILAQTGISAEFSYLFDQPGSYRIKAVGTLLNGVAVPSPEFNVTVINTPEITFGHTGSLLPDTTWQELFTALNLPSPPPGLLWDFGDPASGTNNQSTLANPVHIYQEEGTYSVSLFVAYSDACRDTVTRKDLIQVSLPDPLPNDTLPEDTVANEYKDHLFIPTAFTPNGDGVNDVLYVRGSGIRELEFQIYNEWGERMFISRDMQTGWDGTYRGKALEPDTYVCIARAVFSDGKTQVFTTTSTLLR
ncbi:MAG: hypothetical protein EAZ89_16570 [Bacteroidetes bacterium]|nr:MAG: hypothetical protein EAZ89_16570 [Bacteroidota bacterium]